MRSADVVWILDSLTVQTSHEDLSRDSDILGILINFQIIRLELLKSVISMLFFKKIMSVLLVLLYFYREILHINFWQTGWKVLQVRIYNMCHSLYGIPNTDLIRSLLLFRYYGRGVLGIEPYEDWGPYVRGNC